jgi:hypothetical protein
VESVEAAVRAVSSAGVMFFVACGLFALASGRDAAVAALLLLAGGVVHGTGELMQAAAQFCLSQELAAPHAHGQYQGLASTGFSLSAMLAPTAIALLPIALGPLGWWILGGIFVVLGFALIPAVAWAGRTRERYAPVVHVDG